MSYTKREAIERAKIVPRGCLVSGVRVMHGHNVSKSNRKTNKLYRQNIHLKTLYSPLLGTLEGIKLSTRGQRTITKYGGIDEFLTNCKNRKLTLIAKRLKSKLITKKRELAQ